VTVDWPHYSPDIMPLDYSIWDLVEKAVLDKCPKKVETVEAYKARLRRTALAMPKKTVSKAVRAMVPRMRAVVKAKGQAISRD